MSRRCWKELIKKLSAQNSPFRVMVRSQKGVEKLAALAGAEVAVANFNDSESTAEALTGVDRAFC